MAGGLRERLTISEGRFTRVLIGFMVLGFLSIIVAGIAAVLMIAQYQRHTGWVDHTYDVELAITHALNLNEQAETTRRGYLIARQPTYRDTYRKVAGQLPGALDRIATLTADNPRQQANIIRLRRLIDDIVRRRADTIGLVERGRADAADAAFTAETTARRMRGIRDQAAVMTAEEKRLLTIRDAEQRRSARTFYAIIAVAGILLLLVAIVSLAVVLLYTRDLAISRDRLRTLNDTLEEQVVERTSDLLRANEEIQRFAYIVSHDLRSPLVNVMGFTAELEAATRPLGELVDRAEATAPAILTEEASAAARADLPEAIGFIRTSTQKMDRLINAILKLSREGRRVIAPEPLDLVALVEGITGSMRHVIDEGGIVLTVASPMPALVSDRLAVEQILSNLIENAVKYLEPGRPGVIAVSGSEARGRVSVAVADNGRGIAPADHARVFDLFRRSGRQDQPGEGIGLAHVRALAYRLGGTVDVESELGVGSTFRLNLPSHHEAQDQRL